MCAKCLSTNRLSVFHKPLLPRRYILFCFGRLELVTADGAVVADVRPRGLALLALVAASGKNGLHRARAMSMLWPESTEAHARNSLRQLLFHLRSTLGAELFTRDQRALKLNTLCCDSDVLVFEQLIARGGLGEACARYDGGFLDGFSLPDHEEFSTYVERKRDELEHIRRDALRALARGAEQQGAHSVAVEWWRMLATADPLDPVSAMHQATALERAGRITEAYSSLKAHSIRVQRELGVQPTQSVRTMMERIVGGIGESVVGGPN